MLQTGILQPFKYTFQEKTRDGTNDPAMTFLVHTIAAGHPRFRLSHEPRGRYYSNMRGSTIGAEPPGLKYEPQAAEQNYMLTPGVVI